MIGELKSLKSFLEEYNSVSETISAKRDEFNRQNEELFEKQKQLTEKINELKGTITVTAKEGFLADGIKKRLGGIGIREYTILDYSEDDAFKWAKEKDLFLQLDKKAFEKVAKTGEIDFVKIRKEAGVTFPAEIVIEE